jgi:hypothetical protein
MAELGDARESAHGPENKHPVAARSAVPVRGASMLSSEPELSRSAKQERRREGELTM